LTRLEYVIWQTWGHTEDVSAESYFSVSTSSRLTAEWSAKGNTFGDNLYSPTGSGDNRKAALISNRIEAIPSKNNAAHTAHSTNFNLTKIFMKIPLKIESARCLDARGARLACMSPERGTKSARRKRGEQRTADCF